MKTTNVIECPYCGTTIEPWDFLETGDMEGEFTLECTNIDDCGKEFNVKFKTDVKFETIEL